MGKNPTGRRHRTKHEAGSTVGNPHCFRRLPGSLAYAHLASSKPHQLLHSGETELTLVDPGSPYPEERERLDTLLGCLVENGRSLKRVVLTHHHQDHVGGANWVREKWGVPVASHPLTAELLKGRIDSIQTLQEGDWISGGGNSLFQALWTPGHAPGHLVLLDRERRWLVAGDMVAGASTIVIDPFEGNMGEYLRELERLRALQPRWVYPSHGYPIGGSHALFTRFIEHRLERERQIAACLGSTPQREEELVEQIYRDLHPLARPLAALQARAHLLKMGSEGEGVRTSGRVGRSSLIHFGENTLQRDVEPGHIGGGQAADQCPCALGPHPFNGPPSRATRPQASILPTHSGQGA